ncbi:MAG: guanylate kinase [Bacteroidota bacterium]
MAQGKLIVISAPSGSGKTTIAREIMKRNPGLGFSVSATTRKRRDTEIDGRDYFFLTDEEFRRRVAAGEFVEWEEMYGNLYGTLKTEIDRAISNGQHLVFDVDVKGGRSIKELYTDALLIFICPPSLDTLKQRLTGRRTEDEAALARRLDRVPMEMEMGKGFDITVVNDDLERATAEVDRIVKHHVHS